MNMYSIDKKGLLDVIRTWNSYLKRRVHLIACGGTALTLLNVKESTKDIDFIVPETKEYSYLIGVLQDLGYKEATTFGWKRDDAFIFDLYLGKTVYMTELLESPMEPGNNQLFKEFSMIYVGILNYYDILITKLFRSSTTDIEDCLNLVKTFKKDFDMRFFEKRFRQTASYDTSEEKDIKNLTYFSVRLKDEGLT